MRICSIIFLTALLISSTLFGQGPPAPSGTLTVSPAKSASQQGAGQGQVFVYASGDYTWNGGRIEKIEAFFYKEDGANLIFESSNTDNSPANNKYKTSDTQVTIANPKTGKAWSYTVIAKLYYQDSNRKTLIGVEAIKSNFVP